MTSSNLRIIHYPPKYPQSVHLYITNECNLDCEKCHYRTDTDEKKMISLEKLQELFKEWKRYNVASIAIGGGEPLLHPDIAEIIKLGKELGFFVAVTTNGTVLKQVKPDRVHISYDEIHPTWGNDLLIQKAADYYTGLGCKVGINHVMTKMENLEHLNTFKNIENILLIREKPDSKFSEWKKIPRQRNYWIEGCIEGSRCEQGILSFHVNYDLNASICSNLEKKIKYTTLEETWKELKDFSCSIRDIKTTKPIF
jgi:organic radical activating enzyme